MEKVYLAKRWHLEDDDEHKVVFDDVRTALESVRNGRELSPTSRIRAVNALERGLEVNGYVTLYATRPDGFGVECLGTVYCYEFRGG